MDKLLFDKKDEQNYYQVLNCSSSSNKEQITREYRLLCKQHHPDKANDTDNDKDNEKYLRWKMFRFSWFLCIFFYEWFVNHMT